MPHLSMLVLLGPLELNSSHCLFSHSLGCNHGERIHERVHRSATVVGTRCRLFEMPPFIVAEGPLYVRHSSRREHDPVVACVSGMDGRRGLRRTAESAATFVPHAGPQATSSVASPSLYRWRPPRCVKKEQRIGLQFVEPYS